MDEGEGSSRMEREGLGFAGRCTSKVAYVQPDLPVDDGRGL